MAYIQPPYVQSGQPITSAWGNQVVDAFANHESRLHSGAWATLSFAGAWIVPAGYNPLSYRISNTGENVEIRGCLSKQTAVFTGNFDLATLPGGARPPLVNAFVALTSLQDVNGYKVIRVQITTGGVITLMTGGLTIPVNGSIWFDGIRFNTP